jgi:hypothetical protein
MITDNVIIVIVWLRLTKSQETICYGTLLFLVINIPTVQIIASFSMAFVSTYCRGIRSFKYEDVS